jgi:hypothetical protein
MKPPINVLRLSLHPNGLAPRIRNLAAWRAHLLTRLRRQIEATADAELTKLLRELSDYPTEATDPCLDDESPSAGVAVPLELETEAGVMAFISTTTVFGTPVDITLSELALESFFPADERTAELLRDAAARRSPS